MKSPKNPSFITGPKQTNPLHAKYLQFRKGEIGVAADIREMFSQIRFADSNMKIIIFNGFFGVTMLIFGTVYPPYCAE